MCENTVSREFLWISSFCSNDSAAQNRPQLLKERKAFLNESSGYYEKFSSDFCASYSYACDDGVRRRGCHHGYYGSSSKSFLGKLKPEIIIITNQLGKVYPNVKWNFTMSAKAPFFATYDSNGIIATFTDDGKILMTDNIH